MQKRDLRTLHEILESRGGFGHREHLELAWHLLRRYPIDDARQAMTALIRHVAGLHGAETKYHETITRAWLHFVAVHVQRWDAGSFDAFIERNPELLDRKLIEHFYSPALISGDHARVVWAPPDLRPLPALV